MIPLSNGDVLHLWQGHEANTDQRCSTIFGMRSHDKMRTWQEPFEVWRDPNYVQDVEFINAGAGVQDPFDGVVHYIFTKTTNASGTPPAADTNDHIYAMYTRSTDNGRTWSTPVDISAQAKPSGSGWFIAGPASMIVKEFAPHAGRIVCPIDTRTDTGIDADSYSGCIYSDDHGATWHVGGIVDVADTNESTVVECLDGSLYLSMRHVGSTSSNGDGTFRWYSVSTDGGETWSPAAKTTLTSWSTAGCLCRSGNYLFHSYNGDTNGRFNPSVARSSAASAASVSWTVSKRLNTGGGGYSAICPLGNSEIGCVYEGTHNITWATTQLVSWYQYLLQAVFTEDWPADTTPQRVMFQFNEASSGALPLLGTPLLTQGDYPILGIGGATGTYDSTGLVQAGAGTAATLFMRNLDLTGADAARGSLADPHTGSWSCLIKLFRSSEPSPNLKVILGNRTSSQGWRLSFTSAGLLVWAVNDGSTVTCTSNNGTNLADGTARDVRLVVNRVTNKLDMYINGTLQTSNPAMGTGAIKATNDCIIGASSGTAAAWACSSITFADGILSNDTVPAKIAAKTLTGYNPVAPVHLPSTTNQEIWLARFDNGGRNNATDHEGGWDTRNMPPRAGQGFWTTRDAAKNKLFKGMSESVNRGPNYRMSTGMGLAVRPSLDSGAAGGFWRASPSTDYDFIASTATGTLIVCFELLSLSALGYIFDQMGNSNTAAGAAVYLDQSTGKVGVKMGNGTTSRISTSGETVSASPVFTTGVSYGLAVRWNGPDGGGAGQKIDFRNCTFANRKISGSVNSFQSANLIDAGATGGNGSFSSSARAISIGARADDSAALNWMVRNVMLFSTALTNSAIDAWFAFNVAPVYPFWIPRRRRAA